MKVLHINSYYSGSHFYKNLYDKQKENGLDIDVYVPVQAGTSLSKSKFGEYTTVSKNHNKYDRLLFHIKHRKIYNDVIKKYSLDQYGIVHAHSLFSNGYIALKIKKAYGIPYVVAVRSTDVNLFFKKMVHLRRLGVKILNEAKNVIFLSGTYRYLVAEKYVPSKMENELLSKSRIIPNGIDDFWLQNKSVVKDNYIEKGLKLVYVGVINKRKNLLTTIDAIKVLQKSGYKTKFTIVGRIEDKSIYQQIKDLPYVNYITQKPKEDLIDIYRANDIFIMPSITETFGLVYAEAMSQGLPVIYSRGQGFDGQFGDGVVGYSVDCLDSNEIAQKIVKINEHYNEFSARCIELAKKFKWKDIAKDYKRLYEGDY